MVDAGTRHGQAKIIDDVEAGGGGENKSQAKQQAANARILAHAVIDKGARHEGHEEKQDRAIEADIHAEMSDLLPGELNSGQYAENNQEQHAHGRHWRTHIYNVAILIIGRRAAHSSKVCKDG